MVWIFFRVSEMKFTWRMLLRYVGTARAQFHQLFGPRGHKVLEKKLLFEQFYQQNCTQLYLKFLIYAIWHSSQLLHKSCPYKLVKLATDRPHQFNSVLRNTIFGLFTNLHFFHSTSWYWRGEFFSVDKFEEFYLISLRIKPENPLGNLNIKLY